MLCSVVCIGSDVGQYGGGECFCFGIVGAVGSVCFVGVVNVGVMIFGSCCSDVVVCLVSQSSVVVFCGVGNVGSVYFIGVFCCCVSGVVCPWCVFSADGLCRCVFSVGSVDMGFVCGVSFSQSGSGFAKVDHGRSSISRLVCKCCVSSGYVICGLSGLGLLVLG